MLSDYTSYYKYICVSSRTAYYDMEGTRHQTDIYMFVSTCKGVQE